MKCKQRFLSTFADHLSGMNKSYLFCSSSVSPKTRMIQLCHLGQFEIPLSAVFLLEKQECMYSPITFLKLFISVIISLSWCPIIIPRGLLWGRGAVRICTVLVVFCGCNTQDSPSKSSPFEIPFSDFTYFEN